MTWSLRKLQLHGFLKQRHVSGMYNWQLQMPGALAASTEGQTLPGCLNRNVQVCTGPGVTEKSSVQLATTRTWSAFKPYLLQNKIYLIMEDELWTRALRHVGRKAFTGFRACAVGTDYSWLYQHRAGFCVTCLLVWREAWDLSSASSGGNMRKRAHT